MTISVWGPLIDGVNLPATIKRMEDRRNRTYYAGDLRRELLEAAVAAVSEVGPAHVSLRDLARRVGVSHAAPKNHFADKQALFTAVAVEAHTMLELALDAAVARAGADPVDRFAASGHGYLGFAREHPGHFAVMWREDLIDSSDPALAEASQQTFALLVDLAAAVATGPLRGRDPVQVAVTAWALAHGLADLRAAGALDDLPGADDATTRDAEVVDVMVGLLRASKQRLPN